MSYYDCPKCAHRSYLFGQDGVISAAKEMGCSVIGNVPLDVTIRETSDTVCHGCFLEHCIDGTA